MSPEALLPPGAALEGAATRADLRAAFELGDAVSDALAGTEIVRWAGLHVSESARDTFGRDAPALWRTLFAADRWCLRDVLALGPAREDRHR